MKNIETAGPWITDHEKKVVADVMENGWDNYIYVEKFEAEFAKWHERNFALMTPCCTHAIHLILLALDIKEGDEVIVPECTWTGTSAPITYQNAIPVFADINPINWCLDPDSVKSKITDKTRAIIVVDLYGNMPEMERLEKISKDYEIPLIEDSAEALGSKYKGVRAGKFGIGGVHSFHRTKTLTTGEGGMLLIDDEDLYLKAKFIRDHGRSLKIPYFIEKASVKYMPSNYQAALGYAQFQRIDELVQKKRQIMFWYKFFLKEIPDLQMNMENEDVYNGVWATSLVFGKSHNISTQQAINNLEKKQIPSRPFFYPLSSMPAYKHYSSGSEKDNPVSYDLSSRGITLPCAYSLTENQAKYICEGIIDILN